MAQSGYVPQAQQARNKAVVERYFREVLDQKKIEVLPELLTPDVVLHRPGFDVVGLDAALSGLMAEGDLVAVRISHRTRARPHAFRSRAGEVKLEMEQALNWTAIVQFRLKDGKIAEEWVMRDELGMLLQMGTVTVAP
jgi:hypothetical protein